VNRRALMSLLAGAATWPLAASAQQPEGMRRIGVLMGLPEDDPETKARVARFRQELERLGWTEGRNVRIDTRYAPAGAQAQVLAKELVDLRPDVLLAHSAQITAALHRQTHTIPIVFVNVSDPIGTGFVDTLARPGGNLTGLLHYEEGIAGKWLALLKEIAPRLSRVALVADPKSPVYEYFVRSAKAASTLLAIEVVPAPVQNAADIERVFETFAHASDGGLLLPPDVTTITHRDLITSLAAKHRLPAVYSFRLFVVAGGLMSYGTEQVEMFGQTASYVDRILRGAKPADLPVQAPTKYETVLNLKTAKALGLTVPPGLLVAADEVIE
jgi:putative tryptophan/tyrosine transport system substrate-binding protein